mgnify:CR=1 FL=1
MNKSLYIKLYQLDRRARWEENIKRDLEEYDNLDDYPEADKTYLFEGYNKKMAEYAIEIYIGSQDIESLLYDIASGSMNWGVAYLAFKAMLKIEKDQALY